MKSRPLLQRTAKPETKSNGYIIPVGWRRLEVGEMRQKGDRFVTREGNSFLSLKWGLPIEKQSQFIYIREIKLDKAIEPDTVSV